MPGVSSAQRTRQARACRPARPERGGRAAPHRDGRGASQLRVRVPGCRRVSKTRSRPPPGVGSRGVARRRWPARCPPPRCRPKPTARCARPDWRVTPRAVSAAQDRMTHRPVRADEPFRRHANRRRVKRLPSGHCAASHHWRAAASIALPESSRTAPCIQLCQSEIYRGTSELLRLLPYSVALRRSGARLRLPPGLASGRTCRWRRTASDYRTGCPAGTRTRLDRRCFDGGTVDSGVPIPLRLRRRPASARRSRSCRTVLLCLGRGDGLRRFYSAGLRPFSDWVGSRPQAKQVLPVCPPRAPPPRRRPRRLPPP